MSSINLKSNRYHNIHVWGRADLEVQLAIVLRELFSQGYRLLDNNLIEGASIVAVSIRGGHCERYAILVNTASAQLDNNNHLRLQPKGMTIDIEYPALVIQKIQNPKIYVMNGGILVFSSPN